MPPQSENASYAPALYVENMTIFQTVKIRAVMRNLYSLIMNLIAINKTWVLVNKNTHFSNTRKPDLIEAFKLVKITFKIASISLR